MSDLNRISGDEFQRVEKNPVILILDNIRSGLNVGSIFRSADAFRIEKIYCCGYTPVPPHREVLKSALGATETVAWEFAEEAVEILTRIKSEGVHCYAIEQTNNSLDLASFQLPGKVALILGNEVSGVSQQLIDACDGAIEISQHGTKHSLNVAVCAGIVLFRVTQMKQAT